MSYTYSYLEKQIKEQGQIIKLILSMLEDLGRNVDAIYQELDMVEEAEELKGYDLCDYCSPQYGHICQDMHRV